MYEVEIGRRFGNLTVKRVVGYDRYRNRLVECECVCGKTKVFRYPNLTQGRSKSCGCKSPFIPSTDEFKITKFAPKTDCVMYRCDEKEEFCEGLKDLYCSFEGKCKFYKKDEE